MNQSNPGGNLKYMPKKRASLPYNFVAGLPEDKQFSMTSSEGFFNPKYKTLKKSKTKDFGVNINEVEGEYKYGNTDSELIRKTNLAITKESLILSLRAELKFHKRKEEILKKYKEYSDSICKNYHDNLKAALKYKDQLNEKLTPFRLALRELEVKQVTIQEDRENYIKSSEKQIRKMMKTQNELKTKLREYNNELNIQADDLAILREKIRKYREKNAQFTKQFENAQQENYENYEKLKYAYEALVDKYKYLMKMDEAKKQNDYIKEHGFDSEKLNDANTKLTDIKVKGEYLESVIGQLKNKIIEAESNTKQAKLEQERLRYLGKTIAKKLDDRNASLSAPKTK